MVSLYQTPNNSKILNVSYPQSNMSIHPTFSEPQVLATALQSIPIIDI